MRTTGMPAPRALPSFAALAVAALASAAVLAGCGAQDGGGRDGTAATVGVPAATGAAGGGAALPCPPVPRVPPVADGLPPLELPCLGDGPSVRLSDLRGTPTVLNVWAAWCTNCAREMPLLAAAQRRAGDRLRFFGLHYKAARDQGRRAAVDFGVAFPSVHDGTGDRTVRDLRAAAPPQTLFVRADGTVAGRKVGEIRSQRELDGLVARYLGVRL